MIDFLRLRSSTKSGDRISHQHRHRLMNTVSYKLWKTNSMSHSWRAFSIFCLNNNVRYDFVFFIYMEYIDVCYLPHIFFLLLVCVCMSVSPSISGQITSCCATWGREREFWNPLNKHCTHLAHCDAKTRNMHGKVINAEYNTYKKWQQQADYGREWDAEWRRECKTKMNQIEWKWKKASQKKNE